MNCSELREGPDTVKCIKYEILQGTGRIVRMDNTRTPKNVLNGKALWKKTCGKTMAEMGRQHQGGLLVTVEYKREEEVS